MVLGGQKNCQYIILLCQPRVKVHREQSHQGQLQSYQPGVTVLSLLLQKGDAQYVPVIHIQTDTVRSQEPQYQGVPDQGISTVPG